MRLARLELTDFRSWTQALVDFPAGRVALVGPNASGKTSIVEAAWYAAALASHRGPDSALVGHGRPSAVVRAHVERDARRQIVELEIRTEGASKARVGGSPVRRKREILGILRASLFAPERLAVVRGDPGERRRFTDELIVQLVPRLYGVMRDYDRALRQRNALLRESGGRRPPDLDVWDETLAVAGGELCAARSVVVASLAPHVAEAWTAIAGGGSLGVAYRPNVPEPSDPPQAAAWTDAMRSRIAERCRDELGRGVTLVGPHRDDVALAIGALPARTHASQGEAWLVALALVLAGHRALRERTGEEPVLLLDDALEPLDPVRRERVGEALPPGAQTIITAADPAAVPARLGARVFEVAGGGVHAVS